MNWSIYLMFRHNGLYLYVSRLLRPVWSSPLLKGTVVVKKKMVYNRNSHKIKWTSVRSLVTPSFHILVEPWDRTENPEYVNCTKLETQILIKEPSLQSMSWFDYHDIQKIPEDQNRSQKIPRNIFELRVQYYREKI